jgi:macrodomain Ter protein organizer (MatP/YcbG family)
MKRWDGFSHHRQANYKYKLPMRNMRREFFSCIADYTCKHDMALVFEVQKNINLYSQLTTNTIEASIIQ